MGDTKRDDFTKTTKRLLELQVRSTCSHPDCRIITRGASSQANGTINIGVAAHITAAAPGGPRYDLDLTKEQRRHDSNGIWLCQNHAKLIDSDECHFGVEDIQAWKEEATAKSFAEVTAVSPGSHVAWEADGDSDKLVTELQECSVRDLAAFRSSINWPPHCAGPDLAVVGAEGKSTSTYHAPL